MDPDDQPAWAAYRRTVGTRVRRARLHRRLTQEELADRSGVGRNTVQRIEWGDPEAPRLSALWRLAAVLGVPVHELLTDDAPARDGGGTPSDADGQVKPAKPS